jgi:hypothetical protein
MRIFARHWLFLLFILVSIVFARLSFADSTIDPSGADDPFAIFEFVINVGHDLWYVIKIALLISGIIGIIFIIMGLHKIRSHATDQGGGGHLRHGIILVILGGVLFGVPTLTMLVGNSLFGSAPSPVTTQQAVNCELVSGNYNAPGCGNPCALPGQIQPADGSGSCICPAGMDAATCTPCKDGTGNPTVGGSCSPCPSGFGTTGGICVQCPSGQATYQGVCQACPNGWGNNGSGTCVSCNSGYGTQSGVCVPCTGNQIADQGVCSTCPSNEININGGCGCPQGDYQTTNDPNAQACQPCNASADNYGQYPECPCSARMYSNGSPSYMHCPAYPCSISNQVYIGSACVCPGSGTQGVFQNSCVVCSTLNAQVVAGSCVCNQNSFLSASGCTPCGNNDFGVQAACVCGSGTNTYSPTYPHCPAYPCQPNDYQPGNANCPCPTTLPATQYPNCPMLCPQGKQANPEGVCICADSTQGLFNGQCVPCNQGNVNPADGSCTCNNGTIDPQYGCIVCGIGSGEVVVGGQCVCPQGTTFVDSYCQCNPGSVNTASGCVTCQAGTYSEGASCAPCAPGSYSSAGASACTTCLNTDYSPTSKVCPCGSDHFSPTYPSCPVQMFPQTLPSGCSFMGGSEFSPPTQIKCGKHNYGIPSGCRFDEQGSGNLISTYILKCPATPTTAPW